MDKLRAAELNVDEAESAIEVIGRRRAELQEARAGLAGELATAVSASAAALLKGKAAKGRTVSDIEAEIHRHDTAIEMARQQIADLRGELQQARQVLERERRAAGMLQALAAIDETVPVLADALERLAAADAMGGYGIAEALGAGPQHQLLPRVESALTIPKRLADLAAKLRRQIEPAAAHVATAPAVQHENDTAVHVTCAVEFGLVAWGGTVKQLPPETCAIVPRIAAEAIAAAGAGVVLSPPDLVEVSLKRDIRLVDAGETRVYAAGVITVSREVAQRLCTEGAVRTTTIPTSQLVSYRQDAQAQQAKAGRNLKNAGHPMMQLGVIDGLPLAQQAAA